jgi:ubiquinone/menaquinone biosynthesis C-methylase UbiE
MAGHRVCPWWVGYLLASPLRRLQCDPASLLAPHVREGMTVLEPGPGMGFFTLELARRVGPAGHVIAIDVQPKMIDGLRRRAARAGLLERIDARLARPESLGLGDLSDTVDFALAFAVVHEMPSAGMFFAEAGRALKPGASLLLVEPAGHVGRSDFAGELAAAASAGLVVADRPSVRRSLAALLQRSGGGGRTG